MRWIAVLAGLVAMLVAGPVAGADTLKRIEQKKEIRIGYREATEPFSFVDANGEPAGYSVELCQRVAAAVKEQLGLESLKTRYVPVSVTERFDAVASGKVDILCAAATITLERMASVDFSLMTFVTGGGLLSRAAAPVRMTSDLSGKTVAVVRGTTTETALEKFLADSFIDAELRRADSIEQARQQLDQGQVDAVADDQIVLIGQLMAAGDPREYVVAQDLYSYEPYGLVVPRDDADFRLAVDRVLARLYRSGQYRNLYQKWFGRAGVQPSPILQAMYKLNALPE